MCASWVVVRVQRACLVGVALLASMTSTTEQAGLVELVVVAWTAEVHCVSSPVAVRALHLVVLRGRQSAAVPLEERRGLKHSTIQRGNRVNHGRRRARERAEEERGGKRREGEEERL